MRTVRPAPDRPERRRPALARAAVALTGLLAASLPARADGAPPLDPARPRFGKLDNSLRIAIAPDHSRPLVSVQVWYRIGAVDDDSSRPGICHLARTLMEQRQPLDPGKTDAQVRFESHTLHDACVFHWTAPPQQLASILAAEAERMQPREATAEVIARAFDAASRAPGLRLDSIAFAQHPYARPATAVDDALQATTASRMNEYLGRWFVPGNACVVIVGDIDPNDTINRIRAHFGSVPWADVPRKAEPPPVQMASQELSPIEAAIAGLDLVWPAHRAGAFENRALDILMHHLTNAVDGRLASRELQRGALALRWKRDEWRYGGVLTLSIDDPEMNAERAAVCCASVRETLAAVADDAPDPVAFDRARALTARDERLRRLDFCAWALSLGYAEVVGGDLVGVTADPERLTASGVDQLCAAARRLTDAPLVWRIRTSRPGLAASRPMSLPTVDATRRPGAPEHRETGVHAWPGYGGDLVVVRTLISGDAIEPAGVLVLMRAGSQRWSGEQYRDYLTYHGIDLFPVIELQADTRRIGLESRGPRDRFAAIIELHRDLLRWPRTDAHVDAHAIRRLRQLTDIANARGESLLYAPPGWIGWRTSLPFPSCDTAATHAALASLQHWASLTVEIMGDVSADEVRRQVEATWPTKTER